MSCEAWPTMKKNAKFGRFFWIRFISSVELHKVMADLGERLTEEEVHANRKINTKKRKNEKI